MPPDNRNQSQSQTQKEIQKPSQLCFHKSPAKDDARWMVGGGYGRCWLSGWCWPADQTKTMGKCKTKKKKNMNGKKPPPRRWECRKNTDSQRNKINFHCNWQLKGLRHGYFYYWTGRFRRDLHGLNFPLKALADCLAKEAQTAKVSRRYRYSSSAIEFGLRYLANITILSHTASIEICQIAATFSYSTLLSHDQHCGVSVKTQVVNALYLHLISLWATSHRLGSDNLAFPTNLWLCVFGPASYVLRPSSCVLLELL